MSSWFSLTPPLLRVTMNMKFVFCEVVNQHVSLTAWTEGSRVWRQSYVAQPRLPPSKTLLPPWTQRSPALKRPALQFKIYTFTLFHQILSALMGVQHTASNEKIIKITEAGPTEIRRTINVILRSAASSFFPDPPQNEGLSEIRHIYI